MGLYNSTGSVTPVYCSLATLQAHYGPWVSSNDIGFEQTLPAGDYSVVLGSSGSGSGLGWLDVTEP
jgi:hypothetical protein